MSILDMIGVASILPFVAVLTNPILIETNSFLKTLFQISNIFGVENDRQFIFILGVAVFIILVLSLSVKAIIAYSQQQYITMIGYNIGKRLMRGYLYQPYSWFLNRNSAELAKTILSEVNHIMGSGIRPLLELIAKIAVTFLLLLLLVIVDLNLAIIIGFSIGGAYGVIFYFVRRTLHRIGKENLKNNQLRFMTVSEAFGANKEIKVGGLEEYYIKNFSDASKNFSKTQATASVLQALPRFFLEAIAFGGVMLIILYMMKQTGNFSNILPIISLYVLAGYRLMPALQQVYAALTALIFVKPSLYKLVDDIKSLKLTSSKKNINNYILPLKKSIDLKNIYFSYPQSSKYILKNINLSIPVNSTIGLIGPTGSGKTTIVDIILGLLEPQKGDFQVDGQTIRNQNIRSWQKAIGYVPQYIYLSDDTVAANIALGIEKEKINQEAIEKASKIANLHSFVVSELSKKYETLVGERGVRLSGGQRQRIGIARALYHKPKILILDEATSALDNQTEEIVMKEIKNLSKDLTIIIIAHRLNTIKDCDMVFKIDKGQIIKQN
ncbi:ABC transporter ATP-binding protein/permease [Candidatus Pelagibacter sp.]|nr:ABC transporter ATP-binding protein/permease [Candidatus Pelagibacter sp.]